MPGVHVSLNLEDKAAEGLLKWGDHPGQGFSGEWSWRFGNKGVEQLLHAEGVDGATEKYRRLLPGQILLFIKRMGGAFKQLDVVAKFIHLTAEQLIEERVIQSLDRNNLTDAAVGFRIEKVTSLL